jgi:hypothetical protein
MNLLSGYVEKSHQPASLREQLKTISDHVIFLTANTTGYIVIHIFPLSLWSLVQRPPFPNPVNDQCRSTKLTTKRPSPECHQLVLQQQDLR